MTFSYNPGTSATDRDHMRFVLRDVEANKGPFPPISDGTRPNFSDEELDMMIEVEGDWNRALASCYDALHSAWIEHVTYQADGLSVSMSHIPLGYEKRAARQRKLYGPTKGTGARARTVIRVDGYSQNVPSNMVDDVSY